MNVIRDPAQITFQLEGLERFWALKNRLTLLRADIAQIDYNPQPPPKRVVAFPFLRLPGTAIPGVLFAGTFIKRGERDFWYLQPKYAGVINIRLKSRSSGYDRVMISCDEPSAQEILSWWDAV